MYLQLHIYLIYRDHYCSSCVVDTLLLRGYHGRVRMVVGFTTTYALSAYHHWCFWVRITIRARCTALCDQVCQWLVTGWWFSLGPPVSSTNKTDCHDITESGINHHQTNNRSGWDVQHYDCDKVCQGLANNKTDCHNITEILLKVTLNTMKPNHTLVNPYEGI